LFFKKTREKNKVKVTYGKSHEKKGYKEEDATASNP
jgi:hypothetical protein